jgi:hypothetical protein
VCGCWRGGCDAASDDNGVGAGVGAVVVALGVAGPPRPRSHSAPLNASSALILVGGAAAVPAEKPIAAPPGGASGDAVADDEGMAEELGMVCEVITGVMPGGYVPSRLVMRGGCDGAAPARSRFTS